MGVFSLRKTNLVWTESENVRHVGGACVLSVYIGSWFLRACSGEDRALCVIAKLLGVVVFEQLTEKFMRYRSFMQRLKPWVT